MNRLFVLFANNLQRLRDTKVFSSASVGLVP